MTGDGRGDQSNERNLEDLDISIGKVCSRIRKINDLHDAYQRQLTELERETREMLNRRALEDTGQPAQPEQSQRAEQHHSHQHHSHQHHLSQHQQRTSAWCCLPRSADYICISRPIWSRDEEPRTYSRRRRRSSSSHDDNGRRKRHNAGSTRDSAYPNRSSTRQANEPGDADIEAPKTATQQQDRSHIGNNRLGADSLKLSAPETSRQRPANDHLNRGYLNDFNSDKRRRCRSFIEPNFNGNRNEGYTTADPGRPGRWFFRTYGLPVNHLSSDEGHAALNVGGQELGTPDIARPSADDVYLVRQREMRRIGGHGVTEGIVLVWVPDDEAEELLGPNGGVSAESAGGLRNPGSQQHRDPQNEPAAFNEPRHDPPAEGRRDRVVRPEDVLLETLEEGIDPSNQEGIAAIERNADDDATQHDTAAERRRSNGFNDEEGRPAGGKYYAYVDRDTQAPKEIKSKVDETDIIRPGHQVEGRLTRSRSVAAATGPATTGRRSSTMPPPQKQNLPASRNQRTKQDDSRTDGRGNASAAASKKPGAKSELPKPSVRTTAGQPQSVHRPKMMARPKTKKPSRFAEEAPEQPEDEEPSAHDDPDQAPLGSQRPPEASAAATGPIFRDPFATGAAIPNIQQGPCLKVEEAEPGSVATGAQGLTSEFQPGRAQRRQRSQSPPPVSPPPGTPRTLISEEPGLLALRTASGQVWGSRQRLAVVQERAEEGGGEAEEEEDEDDNGDEEEEDKDTAEEDDEDEQTEVLEMMAAEFDDDDDNDDDDDDDDDGEV